MSKLILTDSNGKGLMELECVEVRPAEMKVIRHRRTPMDILWDISHIGKDMFIK